MSKRPPAGGVERRLCACLSEQQHMRVSPRRHSRSRKSMRLSMEPFTESSAFSSFCNCRAPRRPHTPPTFSRSGLTALRRHDTGQASTPPVKAAAAECIRWWPRSAASPHTYLPLSRRLSYTYSPSLSTEPRTCLISAAETLLRLDGLSCVSSCLTPRSTSRCQPAGVRVPLPTGQPARRAGCRTGDEEPG